MVAESHDLTRRRVLRLTSGAVTAGVASGVASAKSGDDTVEVNVGYSRPSGLEAARSEAREVIWEFNFDAITIRTAAAAAERLERRDDIRYVEKNGTMEALDQTLPWGIDRVDADVAHANGSTGDGVDVAIIDTGIDHDHPDLVDNIGSGEAFVTSTEVTGPEWEDDNGHGSHCAGIADAIDDGKGVVGVSTTATLHAVKVLSATGVGRTSDVAKGIEYVGEQGWAVGSLSLGGGDSSTLKDACEYAYSKNVVLVAAAGNSGECTDCVTYPAAYDECIAVSATNQNDELASFSSQGPEVELAAPGNEIYSTYDDDSYDTLSGTSMACPHVSGAAAQVIASGTTDNARVRTQLKDNAEDIGLSENESGAGLLDVAAALGYDSSDDGTGSGGGSSGSVL